MIQSKEELDDWYSEDDPWGYFKNPQDAIRKARILTAIPKFDFENVLDIGCGNGFLTNDLPGKNVIGMDISQKIVDWANQHTAPNTRYLCGSLFDLPTLDLPPMNLIVITGVLYPQYMAASHLLVYILIDQLLKSGGILLCSHIFDWYDFRFPYLTIKREYFPYREYTQLLEVYVK